MKANSICLAFLIGLAFSNVCRAEQENSTPQQVFDGMRESFQADKAKGVRAKYQWNLSGPNGGDWWIDVEDGKFGELCTTVPEIACGCVIKLEEP